MSETELRLFAAQMSADLFPVLGDGEGMKVLLVFLSLTAGTYAAIYSALELVKAAGVFSIGG